jgi:hypothetical protein
MKRLLLAFSSAALLLSFSAGPSAQADPHRLPLSRKATSLFTSSEDCVACHNGLRTSSGEDVSIGTMWRATMMANSARDPYFQAGLRREVLEHPGQSADIERECAGCHAPMLQPSPAPPPPPSVAVVPVSPPPAPVVELLVVALALVDTVLGVPVVLATLLVVAVVELLEALAVVAVTVVADPVEVWEVVMVAVSSASGSSSPELPQAQRVIAKTLVIQTRSRHVTLIA